MDTARVRRGGRFDSSRGHRSCIGRGASRGCKVPGSRARPAWRSGSARAACRVLLLDFVRRPGVVKPLRRGLGQPQTLESTSALRTDSIAYQSFRADRGFIFARPATRVWTSGEPCTVRHTGPPMWTTTVDRYLPVQGKPAVFASREPLAGLRTESTRGKPGSPRHQCGSAELGISKRINCPRLPGDREPHRGCAGSYLCRQHQMGHCSRTRRAGECESAPDVRRTGAHVTPGRVQDLPPDAAQPPA